MVPGHVPGANCFSQRKHAKHFELTGLNQCYDGNRAPVAHCIEIDIEIPILAARHGTGLLLAWTERHADRAVVGRRADYGNLERI
jgi:hypothetical protein